MHSSSTRNTSRAPGATAGGTVLPGRGRSGRRHLVWGVLALAACQPTTIVLPEQGYVVPEVRAEKIALRHAVYFATDEARIAEGERAALAAFVEATAPTGADYRIFGHADERASDAYNVDLSLERAMAVAELVERAAARGSGVQVSAFGERVPAVPGSNERSWQANRRVEVVAVTYSLSVPACGAVQLNGTANTANAGLSDLGCANAANLAAMVADPADLARGPGPRESEGAPDPRREMGALERYRTDKVKKLAASGDEK
ncbi:MAG: OmpA family protein [Geminicoccaceae bacterium]|nr:OmpA family protein [Geminicoccaceae bacterium]